jgi:type IV pilus assembly protein PilW
MKTSSYKNQVGISLIEIMIALLIGVFLIGGLMQMFINSKQTYKLQDTMSRLQENGRFAVDFLVHDMRGSTGIVGEDNHVSTGSDRVKAGTDTITLSTAATYTDNSGTFTELGYKASVNQYSIYSQGDSGQAALFKSENGGAAQELIEGVEDMQILYGEDTDGDGTPNHYLSAVASNNIDMNHVVSIKFSLLVCSLEKGVTGTPLTYTYDDKAYGDKTFTPSDSRFCRVFSTAVSVRNRLI